MAPFDGQGSALSRAEVKWSSTESLEFLGA